MVDLRAAGVKDSKQLSPDQRHQLEGPIRSHIVAHGFSVISAEVVGDDRYNVNHLELEAMASWIFQVRPKAVYVDVPARAGKGLENFCQTLAWRSGISRSRILGANKADQRFPIVSAASIMAKIHRDGLVDSLRHECGDFGSGYPSDPKTVAYLRALVSRTGHVVPNWVRAKWETYRQLVGEASQPSLFQMENL